MSKYDRKERKIYGKVAAAKTLVGKGKAKVTKGKDTVNKKKDNVVSFVTNLIIILLGFYVLISQLIDILTNTLSNIEREIKITLKQELKGIVSCGVDPSIPAFLKSTGAGITFEVKDIDFLDMFLVDPNSVGGKLMYNDITPTLTNSSDFNTFLYGVIQDDGNTHTWNGIFDVTFNSLGSGIIPNNTLTIKATTAYSNAPKTLTDFNNNFIDSITIFNTENILSKILDTMYGSISNSVKKTTKQLQTEAAINNIIDNITNADNDDDLPDSSFTFTNDEIYQHQEEANWRKKGILKLDCCTQVAATMPIEFITNFNEEMSGVTTTQQKNAVISTNINKMANQNTVNNTNPADNVSIKINFVQGVIDTLIKSIVGMVLSPKVVTIFLVNFKIIYGPTATFDGPVDFIKKNKNLFKSINKRITTLIVKKLLEVALKEIATIVASTIIIKQIERAKNKQNQILSLIGASPNATKALKGL